LAEAGMLTNNLVSHASHFTNVRKQYRLLSERDDLAQAYAGYIPLSVKMVEEMLDGPSGSWNGLDLRDEGNERYQASERHIDYDTEPVRTVSDNTEGMTMVLYVGGITFAEASTLRTLFGKRKGTNQLIIATTKMIQCRSIMQELLDV